MNELLLVFLISIDTSKDVGATSIYGGYEIVNIIRAGAKAKGYKIKVADIDSPLLIPKEELEKNFTGIISLEKEN